MVLTRSLVAAALGVAVLGCTALPPGPPEILPNPHPVGKTIPEASQRDVEQRWAAGLARALDQGLDQWETSWEAPAGRTPDEGFLDRVTSEALTRATRGRSYYAGARWSFTTTPLRSSTHFTLRGELDYRFPKEQVAAKIEEADRVASEVVSRLVTPDMGDYARELALHDWLVQQARYDIEGYRTGKVRPSGYTPYGVLVEGQGVCESYASAFQLLADKAGLVCRTVRGNADGSPHSWNQVMVEGQWYNLDVTWDDPVGGLALVGHDYFNLDDASFSGRHSWDRADTEVSTSLGANWYKRQGLSCPDLKGFTTLVDRALKQRQPLLQCRLEAFSAPHLTDEVTTILKQSARQAKLTVGWTSTVNPDAGVVEVHFRF